MTRPVQSTTRAMHLLLDIINQYVRKTVSCIADKCQNFDEELGASSSLSDLFYSEMCNVATK